MEAISADLLLLVIDVSDPAFRLKIDIVEKTLNSLPVSTPNRLYVFNKIDAAKVDRKGLAAEFSAFSPQFVSAKEKTGLPTLKKTLEKYLRSG
jgi:GTP-binding protein HflX